jgi:hypothetical protein
MEVLTSPEAIAQALQNDPNLPLMFQGPAAVEPLGQPNWDLQQHIISRSTPHPDVPSIYLPSVSAPTAPITPSATPNATARCANGDLACITGVGQQQNAPISAESVANSAAQLSRQAGVVAAGATLATAQASPHVKPITGAVAVGATVIGVAADVVEQLARPDVGQAVVNLIGTTAVEAANKAVPIAAPITNEVVELLKNTNKAGEIRDGSNIFIEEIKR